MTNVTEIKIFIQTNQVVDKPKSIVEQFLEDELINGHRIAPYSNDRYPASPHNKHPVMPFNGDLNFLQSIIDEGYKVSVQENIENGNQYIVFNLE